MRNLTAFCSAALTRSQIVHLHFTPAWRGGEGDMFFGSLAAIFEMFSPDELGVDLRTLYAVGLVADGIPFRSTAGAVIRKVSFYRKRQGILE